MHLLGNSIAFSMSHSLILKCFYMVVKCNRVIVKITLSLFRPSDCLISFSSSSLITIFAIDLDSRLLHSFAFFALTRCASFFRDSLFKIFADTENQSFKRSSDVFNFVLTSILINSHSFYNIKVFFLAFNFFIRN